MNQFWLTLLFSDNWVDGRNPRMPVIDINWMNKLMEIMVLIQALPSTRYVILGK